MSMDIILPRLGFSMSEGTIAEWLVTEGAMTTQGEPLYSVESDKSVQEIEASASGKLQILVPAGELVPVGTVIGRID